MPRHQALHDALRRALQESLPIVEQALKEGAYISRYHDFPTIRYEESGLPAFWKSSGLFADSPLDFKSVFNPWPPAEPPKLASYDNAWSVVVADDRLRTYFDADPSEQWIGEEPHRTNLARLNVDLFVQQFVDHYVHRFDTRDYIEVHFETLYELFEPAALQDKLPVCFAVPLLIAGFDAVSIRLTEDISIERIPERLQLARNIRVSATTSAHTSVVGAATHAMFLANWVVVNPSRLRRNFILSSIEAYADVLPQIDRMLGSLRAQTGLPLGYAQIVVIPDGWEDDWKAHLIDPAVLTVRAYPEHFENYGWSRTPALVSSGDCGRAALVYEAALADSSNRLDLALNRLNASYLRNSEEDRVLDLCIGLETLLTHDSPTEVTYRLAMRLAGMTRLISLKSYDPATVFALAKQLYAYRSAVAHGLRTKEKKRVVRVREEEEVPVVSIGEDFLRHVIRGMATHLSWRELESLDLEILAGAPVGGFPLRAR